MTPRRAAVLALQLPAGAQVWLSAGLDSSWTAGEHLLASTVDALRGANWQRSGGKGDRPEPITRPSARSAERTETDRMRARAHRFKQRQGES